MAKQSSALILRATFTSAKVEVMRSVRSVCHSVSLSVCLSVCRQDYYTSKQPISLKLGVMIGLTNQKNLLTFAADPVPDTDSGALFHFHHH